MRKAREEIVGRKEELWFTAPAIPSLSLDNVNSLIDDCKENCIFTSIHLHLFVNNMKLFAVLCVVHYFSILAGTE